MRIGIIGCAGRMGRALMTEILRVEGAELSGGVEHDQNPALGTDLGILIGNEKLGKVVSSDLEELLANSDAVINFTTIDATLVAAQKAAEAGVAHIIGTTGMNDAQLNQLHQHAKNAVVVHAHNYSVGVNVLMNLVEQTARTLPADMFDIEVLEMHHNKKVDSPSGTAISLGESAAKGRDVNLNDVACKSRDGIVGARPAGEIGFATLRGGDVVGDHTVMFASPLERIELTHKAQDRSLFAHGAVRAALWSKGKKAGLYSMQDVLGLK